MLSATELQQQKALEWIVTFTTTANKLRKLAMTKYGCTGFTSYSESNKEIAISYWPNLEAIKGWKKDIEHQQAQKLGKEKWCSAY